MEGLMRVYELSLRITVDDMDALAADAIRVTTREYVEPERLTLEQAEARFKPGGVIDPAACLRTLVHFWAEAATVEVRQLDLKDVSLERQGL